MRTVNSEQSQQTEHTFTAALGSVSGSMCVNERERVCVCLCVHASDSAAFIFLTGQNFKAFTTNGTFSLLNVLLSASFEVFKNHCILIVLFR